MAKIVACGIDIGTHYIKVMVCERVISEDGREIPKIIATGYSESRGLRHGYIINIQEITRGIREAVDQVEKIIGQKIKRAFLGVGGIGLSSLTHQAHIMISRADGEISDLDVKKVLKTCEESLPNQYTLNKKVLHTIPVMYKVDGRVILSRPQGMKGSKLEVRALFISCLEQHLNDLVEATNGAGVEVEDVMAAPMASSLVAVTTAQKIAGCVLANIGAETTSVVVFENNYPVSLEVFPLGGIDITHDIALGMRVTIEEAEQVKRGGISDQSISDKKLKEIMYTRLTDTFELIEAHLKKHGKSGLLPAGIIITGGSAQIQGIEDIAKAILKLPSRIAKNAFLRAELRSDEQPRISDSVWSVAFGLCLFGLNQESSDSSLKMGFIWLKDTTYNWIKQFLP